MRRRRRRRRRRIVGPSVPLWLSTGSPDRGGPILERTDSAGTDTPWHHGLSLIAAKELDRAVRHKGYQIDQESQHVSSFSSLGKRVYKVYVDR